LAAARWPARLPATTAHLQCGDGGEKGDEQAGEPVHGGGHGDVLGRDAHAEDRHDHPDIGEQEEAGHGLAAQGGRGHGGDGPDPGLEQHPGARSGDRAADEEQGKVGSAQVGRHHDQADGREPEPDGGAKSRPQPAGSGLAHGGGRENHEQRHPGQQPAGVVQGAADEARCERGEQAENRERAARAGHRGQIALPVAESADPPRPPGGALEPLFDRFGVRPTAITASRSRTANTV
jgi:hypothetical protein